MINLLPVQKKKDLRAIYRAHMTVATSTFIVLLGAFSAIVAGIMYWGHTMEHAITEEWITVAKEGEEAVYVEEIREELDEMNTMIELLSPEGESYEFVYERIFLRIADARTGVVIRGMGYEAGEEGGTIHVRGVADTREDLVGFARALEAEGFSGIDIPVGSFISESDIDFSLTFQE
jgi:hypothetical protein